MRILTIVLLTILVITSMHALALKKRSKSTPSLTFDFLGSTQNYRRIGSGTPIVLLHGSMVASGWSGFEDKLAEQYSVYIPDLPGFGGSSAIDGKLHNSDLFTLAFCEFLKVNNLESAPIISLSLGSIVSLKSARNGCSTGKLILVGLPTVFGGWRAKIAQKIPLLLKRIIVATDWGKRKVLTPALNENTEGEAKEGSDSFIRDLAATDVRAIADVDYEGDIHDSLSLLTAVGNQKLLLYGEFDTQRKGLSPNEYRVVLNAGHNIFSSNQDHLLTIVEDFLK